MMDTLLPDAVEFLGGSWAALPGPRLESILKAPAQIPSRDVMSTYSKISVSRSRSNRGFVTKMELKF